MSLYETRAAELLQIHGLRRTQGRIALLKVLAKANGPISTEYLQGKLSEELGTANLYRALDSFSARGIVTRFEFGSGRAFYEIAHDKPHHHHVICESCGVVKDVPAHDSPDLTKAALKHASGFTSISRHSLEFYGRCATCV